jgi:hypothetical protein
MFDYPPGEHSNFPSPAKAQSFADFGQKRRDPQLPGGNKRGIALFIRLIRFPCLARTSPRTTSAEAAALP